ncbi:hypothetical protein CONLIGDRAFT_650756 [Coniochaeta ligniaria NRRL 30616]|uniref:Uncharacterized protein n=1 Tax=Coniochaeta ligniaria NRRL 30616 TaxID=1408157 RepID=A0A1J7IX55_9PEZI|nr:hypothetical protein CONLIGDRAFT_650756 [Coniochaeta ligniaria NRRL 30616]
MANQPNDQPDGPPSQSGQPTSQNSQNIAHPRPKKLGVNLSTIRYLDESVTSLPEKMDPLLEMVRTQMSQTQQLAAQVARLAAQSPRRKPSPRREPSHQPSLAGDDDFEMTGHRQLPHRERAFREITSHREIKPKNGRQSFAPAGRQRSAYPYNQFNSPFNRQSGSPFESKACTYIKRSEVGQFNATCPDPDNLGIVSNGKTLVFTDVMAFQERLYSFTSDANPEAKSQVVGLLDTLFSGSTLIWWNSEHTAQDHRDLRNGGLPAVLDVLRQRFRQDPAIASAKFTQGRLGLSDLADDDTGDLDPN